MNVREQMQSTVCACSLSFHFNLSSSISTCTMPNVEPPNLYSLSIEIMKASGRLVLLQFQFIMLFSVLNLSIDGCSNCNYFEEEHLDKALIHHTTPYSCTHTFNLIVGNVFAIVCFSNSLPK